VTTLAEDLKKSDVERIYISLTRTFVTDQAALRHCQNYESHDEDG